MNGKVLTLFLCSVSFLETDIKEQRKCKKIIQTTEDNTARELRYEFKFENCKKDKMNFLLI